VTEESSRLSRWYQEKQINAPQLTSWEKALADTNEKLDRSMHKLETMIDELNAKIERLK
jgi:hypothetical protein